MSKTPDLQNPQKALVGFYLCPTPGCGNYYGSSSMVDLSKEVALGRPEDHVPANNPGRIARHTRAECPDCRARGQRVERVLVATHVALPGPVASPEIPAAVGAGYRLS